MAAVETQEIRAQSYVGFETITRQIEHKLLKRGFQFNVMVVGVLHYVPSVTLL
jgi:septin 3/9/12